MRKKGKPDELEKPTVESEAKASEAKEEKKEELVFESKENSDFKNHPKFAKFKKGEN